MHKDKKHTYKTYEELAKIIPCSVEDLKALHKQYNFLHATVRDANGEPVTKISVYESTIPWIRGLLSGRAKERVTLPDFKKGGTFKANSLSRAWVPIAIVERKHCNRSSVIYRAVKAGRLPVARIAGVMHVVEADALHYLALNKPAPKNTSFLARVHNFLGTRFGGA